MTRRRAAAFLIGVAPIFAIAACGGDGDDSTSSAQDDAATGDVAVDTSTADDASLEAPNADGSTSDAHGDAGAADAAKTVNRCGGYDVLELGGTAVTPGSSCGTCGDGTITCVGSNTVACAGATLPPCPTPPVDAGPNACGGYAPLAFLSQDVSVGDACGECGQIQCGSANALVCTSPGGFCSVDAGLQSTCSISSAAFTATPASPTLPAETRPTTTSTSSIGLPASDLAYNPYDGLLYASIINVSQGNSIAKIDPISATVLDTVYVGPQPTHISLSDDGSTLWVAVGTNGYNDIRRVDLTTFTAGDSFALPPVTSVEGIRVLPGTNDSVAVSRYDGYPNYGYSTIVFDNGVPRPYGFRAQSQATTMPVTGSASLLLVGSAYGYPYGMEALCIDDNGGFLHGLAGQVTYVEPSAFYGGVVYAAEGKAYDAQTNTLLHTFALPPGATYFLPAADVNDVYYLTTTYQGSGTYWIQVTGFDRTTYASTITDLLQPSGTAYTTFLRWGRYGFAYLNGSTIEIARSTIIPDMP